PPLTPQREESEEGQIEVVPAGTVELVASRVAKADPGRLCELRYVKPRSIRSDIARQVVGADQICRIISVVRAETVVRRVQTRATRGHRERSAAERRKDTVDLPVVCEGFREAPVFPRALPRQGIDEPELEVVAAIEARRRPVAIQFARRVP